MNTFERSPNVGRSFTGQRSKLKYLSSFIHEDWQRCLSHIWGAWDLAELLFRFVLHLAPVHVEPEHPAWVKLLQGITGCIVDQPSSALCCLRSLCSILSACLPRRRRRPPWYGGRKKEKPIKNGKKQFFGLTFGSRLDCPISAHIVALWHPYHHYLAAAAQDKKRDRSPQCPSRRPPPQWCQGQPPCPLAGSHPRGIDCQQWVLRKHRCVCGGARGCRGGAVGGAGEAAVGSCLALPCLARSYQWLSYSCASLDRVFNAPKLTLVPTDRDKTGFWLATIQNALVTFRKDFFSYFPLALLQEFFLFKRYEWTGWIEPECDEFIWILKYIGQKCFFFRHSFVSILFVRRIYSDICSINLVCMDIFIQSIVLILFVRIYSDIHLC